MYCTTCGTEVSPDTDGLALRTIFNLELTRKEQSILNRLNAEETICIECKREMFFAGMLVLT